LTLAAPAFARAEVVTLAELEKKAMDRDTLADGHAARVRGAEADVRKSAAAYYPQVGLRLETNAAPGRNLVTICPVGGQ
jgi:hypothetical protein